MPPTSRNNISSVVQLKKEIEETFGKKISTSGDCVVLCNQIYSKTDSRLNASTLRRFFGLVKSDFKPATTTLDILSKYCGFTDFDDFTISKNDSTSGATNNFDNNSILNYLVSHFNHTHVKDPADKTFIELVKNTIIFLRRHPELTDKFQRMIAKTKSGQEFYFEQFINLDELNSFYGDGLHYYLMEKDTREAQIFGHSLLCLKHW